MWQCPICSLGFVDIDMKLSGSSSKVRLTTWKCPNNHCFDVAKQGYVNLLPVQNKRSKEPGDDKTMIVARHNFLRKNYYLPIVNAVRNIVDTHLGDATKISEAIHLYDAGCGTGYYINELAALYPKAIAAGHDISKNAVQVASANYKTVQFAVASSINIPIQTSSQDVVLEVFSPSCEQQYDRILKETGLLITVNPAAYHLKELKALLYDAPDAHSSKAKEFDLFELIDTQALHFEIEFESPMCSTNLLTMTPYYWKANDEQKQNIKASLAKVTAHFEINVYKKLEIGQGVQDVV